MVDQVANFKKVTVSTGYNNTATSIVLAAGQGAELPDPSGDNYNVVWWDSTNYNDPADDPNVEIVRVTAKSTDTLTVTRNQESSGASAKNNADATYKMILPTTAKTITDLIADVEKAATVIVGKSGHVDYLTTDYGSDDACIKAAIDYVSGLGGGSVLIREGTYSLDSNIDGKTDVNIYGVGFETILKPSNSSNVNVIESTSISNTVYSHFKIDGNKANQSSDCKGIRIQDSTNIKIEDVWFTDIYQHGINTAISAGSHDLYILNNYFTNIGKSAVIGSAIYINDTDSCQIIGNIIDTCTADGIQGGNVSSPPDNFIVSDNILLNCGRYGIYFLGANHIHVTNNTINNVTNIGIFLQTLDDAILTENTSINCGQDGIRVEDCNYCTVSNNTSKNNNTTDGTNYGIRLRANAGTCTYNVVTGNRCYDTNGTPKQDSGIIEFGGDYNIINDNIVTPNLSTNLVKAGNNTITIDNIGYNPIGAVGPPSVPATTVNYTNTYGYPCQVQVYGGTVTEIDIDDIATGLTSGVFMIPSGGTINTTYSAAPSWRWWGL